MSRLTNFNNKEGNKMPEIIQITKLAIRLDDTGELKELPYNMYMNSMVTSLL